MNEYLDVDFIREIRQWTKVYTTITPITKDKTDKIEKKRAEKRWKQSYGYYLLHPEKFRFGLKNLK